jgi:dCTP deaminase
MSQNFYSSFSGVLSDLEIIKEKDMKNIIIHPFESKNLSNSSYDVTLGPWYYRASKDSNQLLLPWKQDSVESYWGSPCFANTITEENNPYFLPIGTQYILLEPNELILASTIEFIGTKKNLTTMMKARSSMGRIGISICKDAGWGDIGYINRWTLEISNFSNATIPLIVGSRVAQIVFFRTGDHSKPYHISGAYQTTDDLEMLEKFWNHYDMLPKFRF